MEVSEGAEDRPMSSTMVTSGEENVVDGASLGLATSPMEESSVEAKEEEKNLCAMGDDRWVFKETQLKDTPSRKCGVDPHLETRYRRHIARFIAELARQLQVSQLTVNSAIVMMHRFYMHHSFTRFNLFEIGMTCLFLACKAEEQLRKMSDLVKVCYGVLTSQLSAAEKISPPDIFTRTISLYKRRLLEGETVEQTMEDMVEKVIEAELCILGTLGFDLSIEHAHTYVAQGCKELALPVEISKKAYLFANASLIDTRMCLRHKPRFVACVCIAASLKASGFNPPVTSGGEWWTSIDKGIEKKLLDEVTQNFLKSQPQQQLCVNGKNPAAIKIHHNGQVHTHKSPCSSTTTTANLEKRLSRIEHIVI